ncbi:MAG: hypothetical protein LBI62_05430 [Candidatus Accumulibacter sp.]|jgi:hypothetical protein|nr:hypothetical protein [Accumulibacter sp.]
MMQKPGWNETGLTYEAEESSSPKTRHFLYQDLLEQLNPKAPLLILTKRLPWDQAFCGMEHFKSA